jgi:hypothetical protein
MKKKNTKKSADPELEEESKTVETPSSNSSAMNAFYLKEPYVFLINPNLLPNDVSIIKNFPVKDVLPAFVNKMKEEFEYLDFKILGNATANSVKIHRTKIDLAIKHQLRLEVKEQKTRTESQFDGSNIIPYWFAKPRMVLASQDQKQIFFEELLITFEELENFMSGDSKKEKVKKLRNKKPEEDETKPKNRRRKLTADALSHFNYMMNFELTDVANLVDLVWHQIYQLLILQYATTNLKELENQEVLFDLIFIERIKEINESNQQVNQERLQLEKVRTLMSILYLIQDHKIEAWQDEDTLEIGVKLLKFPIED